jgi:putative heme iron utilization protein
VGIGCLAAAAALFCGISLTATADATTNNFVQVFAPRTVQPRAMTVPQTQRPLQREVTTVAAAPKDHSVKGMPKMSEEEMKLAQALQEHQKEAARLSHAEDARNMMQYGTGYGVISTNSESDDGYPSGSIVGYAPDDKGRPVFSFSTMSSHTQDIQKDPRVSLTVTVEGFKGAADGRVSLTGDLVRVPKEEKEAVAAMYLKKHPDAFWVQFGDFSWWRMENIKTIRYIGGFARAGSITPEEYEATAPDAIAAFATPVMSHMNADHGDANVAMVNHYLPIQVEAANIVGLDRLGMDMMVTREGQSFKLRLPFPRPATNRKEVKDLIVEMTKASAKAAAPAPAQK